MKPLTIQDFEKISFGTWDFYFTYKTDKYEITMEPCADGYDVGLYDQRQILIYPKHCTKTKGSFYDKRFRAVFDALRMANIFYQEMNEKYLRAASEQLGNNLQ